MLAAKYSRCFESTLRTSGPPVLGGGMIRDKSEKQEVAPPSRDLSEWNLVPLAATMLLSRP